MERASYWAFGAAAFFGLALLRSLVSTRSWMRNKLRC
jgi:hypothetical protein